MTFEQLDRAIDADSDSDDELAEQAHLYKRESLGIVSWYYTNVFQSQLVKERTTKEVCVIVRLTYLTFSETITPSFHIPLKATR